MADKGTTWLNGSGVGTHTRPDSVQTSDSSRSNLIRTLLIAAAITAASTFFLHSTPDEWTWELLRIMGVGLVLLAAFYFPRGAPKPAFVIWFVMLIGECIFFREGDTYSNANAYAGQFPTSAYGEAICWIMCFLAAIICSSRIPGFIGRLFTGDYKWVSLFAVLSAGSCIYAPRLSLALVWGFKILLVAVLLLACSSRIRNFKDTISFLCFTIFAYAIIVLQPVIIAALRNDMFDDEGRMSTIVSPNALSPNAAIVLLMTLILFSNRKGEGLHKSAVFLGLVGVVVMILAGSKTGILAAILAGTVFFLIRGKLGTAFTYIAVTGVLVTALVLTTPLGDYFHLYQDREGAESFSGRTILWKAVTPEIIHKPIIGHGYMASEFLMFQVNAVGWAAPHLHNGFMEALYNGGLLGFIFTLMTLVVIPKNLIRVFRLVPKDDPLYRVAAGSFALYAFLCINGFFNSSFGGKCTPPFMVLLALVVVSIKLHEYALEQTRAIGGLTRLVPEPVGV